MPTIVYQRPPVLYTSPQAVPTPVRSVVPVLIADTSRTWTDAAPVMSPEDAYGKTAKACGAGCGGCTSDSPFRKAQSALVGLEGASSGACPCSGARKPNWLLWLALGLSVLAILKGK